MPDGNDTPDLMEYCFVHRPRGMGDSITQQHREDSRDLFVFLGLHTRAQACDTLWEGVATHHDDDVLGVMITALGLRLS